MRGGRTFLRRLSFVQRERYDALITAPTIPGNYLFQKEGRSCRERYVWARKRRRRKGEKNDIKSNQQHDALSVGNFMFQLAGEYAIAYILFFFQLSRTRSLGQLSIQNTFWNYESWNMIEFHGSRTIPFDGLCLGSTRQQRNGGIHAYLG